MRHAYEGKCWCTERHTPGEAYDLTVHGRTFATPDSYDKDAALGIRELAEQSAEKLEAQLEEESKT